MSMENKTKPIISCITPTFNRSELLSKAIESTINQSYENWEMIIVDDGSTDNTEDVVKKIINTDNRIKYFLNPGKGGSAARNYGVKQAKGEWIAFLDDDDENLPHRFQSQLDAAIKSNSSFVVSGYNKRTRKPGDTGEDVRLELKGMGAGFPSRWLIKKELLEKVRGFDESFPSMQEIELSYRISKYEDFVLHNDVVTVKYHTPNSVSKRKDNALRGKMLLVKKHSAIIPSNELNWWQFIIAMDAWLTKDLNLASKSFNLACNMSRNKRYCIYFRFFQIMKVLNVKPNKIIRKLHSIVGKKAFTSDVIHRVI